jgi:hypothetical protein
MKMISIVITKINKENLYQKHKEVEQLI